MPNQRPAAPTPVAGAKALLGVKKGLFRKEGEYWTVGLGGNGFRLRDVKGLAYIAHLLRHPATEFHSLDLVGGISGRGVEAESNPATQGLPQWEEDLEKAGIHIASLGDAGEMLDEQAKADYRRRLAELRQELEDAKRLGSVERAERVEAEIDALSKELSRAVGLGGRNRRAASASERARQTINQVHQDCRGEGHPERSGVGRDLFPVHQNGVLLLLSTRSRLPDCMGICGNRGSEPDTVRFPQGYECRRSLAGNGFVECLCVGSANGLCRPQCGTRCDWHGDQSGN